MRILVTGAAGFIGQHVCNALNRAKHDVIGLDKCEQPVDISMRWIENDITQPLANIPAELDAVIHLAAVANPRECDTDPTKAFDVNVNGTLQVLRMALASGAKKFVFSSSAHVYDIPPRYMPTDESHPLRLNNTYTTTKILGEQLCQLFWENHGLSYTVLRLFNAYGPGQGAGYFIPDMVEKAKSGKIELSGGNTTKDFVSINDVAQAFKLAVESAFVGPINIGTGIETSLTLIAARIANAAGAAFEHEPGRLSRGTRMQCDASRAYSILGWEPGVSLEEGLSAILSQTGNVGIDRISQ